MRRSEKIRLLGFSIVLMIAIIIGYFIIKPEEKLRIYNPSDLNPKLVDESVRHVKQNHTIGDFQLINQDGNIVKPTDLEGSVYVSDFFFTTCQSICPKMTTQMARVYQEFKDKEEVKFISHTVQPEVDSVQVLKNYSEKYGADADRWMMVTGDKKQIYDLARKSYFAVTTEGDGGKEDFIHTENFILIDKEKRIRGFYDGTSTEDVDRLIEEINILLKEYEQ